MERHCRRNSLTTARGLPSRWLVATVVTVLLGDAAGAAAQQPIGRFPPVRMHAAAAAAATRLPGAALRGRPADRAATVGSWDELVRTVKIGRRVGVWLPDLPDSLRLWFADSVVVKGDLLAIDDHSITVRQKHGPRVIPSAQVRRIRYLTHASRYAFLGGIVAADLTCAILESRSSHPEPGECLDVGTVVFGLPAGGIASLLARGPDLYVAAPAPVVTP